MASVDVVAPCHQYRATAIMEQHWESVSRTVRKELLPLVGWLFRMERR